MTAESPGAARADLFGQRLLAAAHQRLTAGDLGEAERLTRAALDLPGAAGTIRARLLNLLGGIQRVHGDHAASLSSFDAAIAADENLADAHANRAAALIALGRSAEAPASLDRALALDPSHQQALNTAGVLLAAANRLEAAVDCYRRAIDAGASDVDTLCNLGNALGRLDRLEEAEAAFLAAQARDPAQPRPFAGLGKVAMDGGRLEQADEDYRAVLDRVPNDADAHMSRGFIALLRGDLAAGWAGYEWRWRLRDGPTPPPEPRWRGEALAGRTLLLQAEQGFGDTLQCVRYAKQAARQGARVIVRCQRPLVRLLETAPGVDVVVAMEDSLPRFDFAAAMLDLPGLFGTTLETVPADIPYLTPPSPVSQLDAALGDDPRPKVGLVWAGNPRHRNDRRRSLPEDAVTELIEDAAVRFFSLQKPAASTPDGMTDLAPILDDFADTAAAIARFDLVVSVDTSVAHLAGALGKPVWVLLPFAPDWRWMVGRTDSPWYPTMRLFRQEGRGDWPGVIARVRKALSDFRP